MATNAPTNIQQKAILAKDGIISIAIDTGVFAASGYLASKVLKEIKDPNAIEIISYILADAGIRLGSGFEMFSYGSGLGKDEVVALLSTILATGLESLMEGKFLDPLIDVSIKNGAAYVGNKLVDQIIGVEKYA